MVSNDERLIALWHALDSTELGRTKEELRRVVPGYSDIAGAEAFERMFSRDKAALRKAGARVETRGVGTAQERYRLSRKQAGPVVDLTPAEVGAVRLAAQMWGNGDLSGEAVSAAQRLTGAISDNEELFFSAPIPYIPTKGDLLHPLVKAIGNRNKVRFEYRNSGTGEPRQRFVEPWRLAFRDGGWYLLGRDVDLAQPRAFRLTRIVGDIHIGELRNAFQAVADIDVSALLGETGHFITATLALAPGKAARLRAAALPLTDDIPVPNAIPAGFDIIKYRYDDEREFADELAGLGANVVILGPPQLKAAVMRRLQKAADLAAAAIAGGGVG